MTGCGLYTLLQIISFSNNMDLAFTIVILFFSTSELGLVINNDHSITTSE